MTVARRKTTPRIKKQKAANVMGREPYFSGRERRGGEKNVDSVGISSNPFKSKKNIKVQKINKG